MIGLFGGRFDPVHRAHQAIATAAADALKLSQIRWIVTATPPHKPAIAPAQDRLAMVQLAVDTLHDPRMVVDDREIKAALRGESNFTADTLMELKQQFSEQRFIWILGEDQLRDFTTWSRWEWLLQNMALAVVRRADEEPANRTPMLDIVGAKILWIPLAKDSVSSTLIRTRIKNGESIAGLTPSVVEDYIQQHRLYLAQAAD